MEDKMTCKLLDAIWSTDFDGAFRLQVDGNIMRVHKVYDGRWYYEFYSDNKEKFRGVTEDDDDRKAELRAKKTVLEGLLPTQKI